MIELYREAFRLGFKSKKIGITSSWPDEALGAFIKKNGCMNYKLKREFLTVSPHKDEDEYPLAYSIVVHQGAGQVNLNNMFLEYKELRRLKE